MYGNTMNLAFGSPSDKGELDICPASDSSLTYEWLLVILMIIAGVTAHIRQHRPCPRRSGILWILLDMYNTGKGKCMIPMRYVLVNVLREPCLVQDL